MTAHQLWLWLHEAMQGIPAWWKDVDGEMRRSINFAYGSHVFEKKDWTDDDVIATHEHCFDHSFIQFLRGEQLLNFHGAPEAALHLLERARAAWNGQVYGDERDAEIEARRMREGER